MTVRYSDDAQASHAIGPTPRWYWPGGKRRSARCAKSGPSQQARSSLPLLQLGVAPELMGDAPRAATGPEAGADDAAAGREPLARRLRQRAAR